MENNYTIETITRLVVEALKNQEEKGNGYTVPIGVSARHIHLTQEHVEILFGKGYQLTKKKDLMGGQFAANETVTIVGLKLRAIENVRVLGPTRKASQVEISATDAVKLGVKAPIRESGDIAGSAPIALVGPQGALYIKGRLHHRSQTHSHGASGRRRLRTVRGLHPTPWRASANPRPASGSWTAYGR